MIRKDLCVLQDIGNGVIRLEYYVQNGNDWKEISEVCFSISCVCMKAVMSLMT